MKKEKQKNIRLTHQQNNELTEILKEINKNCNSVSCKFTLSQIVEDFIEEYKTSTPHGLKIQNKQLNKELEEKKEALIKLNDEITKIQEQIKENENKINNINKYDLVNFIHNNKIMKAIDRLEAYKEEHKNLYNNIKDIPEEKVKNIAINFKISYDDLKEIINYNY